MENPQYQQALPDGTLLENYTIVSCLGAGGFGVTYKALDRDLNCHVAIKEYFPNEYALRDTEGHVHSKSLDANKSYEFGLDKFIQEAQTLARFKHPNIIRINRFFRSRGTAYLVMDYEEGQTFAEFLKHKPRLDEQELLQVIIPVLRGLREVHAAGFLHRDIKPSNIYLRSNGEPCLIDFGASRFSLGEYSRSVTSVVTAGYAPFEQYASNASTTAATDLYAIGATLYRSITGKTPVEALERIHAQTLNKPDPQQTCIDLKIKGYSQKLLNCTDWLLAVAASDRPQSVDQLFMTLAPEEARATEPESLPASDDEDTMVVKPGLVDSLKGPGPTWLRWALPMVFLGLISSGAFAWYYWDNSKEPGKNRSLKVDAGDHIQLASGPPDSAPPRASRVARARPAQKEAGVYVGNISVVTEPAGAVWYLDGAKMGGTPGKQENIKSGPHKLRIELEGYQTIEKTVFVPTKKTLSIKEKLQKNVIKFGLKVRPAHAKVVFAKPGLTYQPLMQLPQGIYKVTVSAPGYKTRAMEVNVRPTRYMNGYIRNHRYEKLSLEADELQKTLTLENLFKGETLDYIPGAKRFMVWVRRHHAVHMGVNRLPQQFHLARSELRLYDADTQKLRKKFTVDEGLFALSNNRKHLFVLTSPLTVEMIQLDTMRRSKKFIHNDGVRLSGLAVSPKGNQLATVADQQIFLWSLPSASQFRVIPLSKPVKKIAYTNDGKHLLVVEKASRRIKMINPLNSRVVREFGDHSGYVNRFVLSPDRRNLYATTNYGKYVYIWDFETTSLRKKLKLHSRGILSIALTSNGRYLLSSAKDNTVKITNTQDLKTIRQFYTQENPVVSLDVHKRRQLLGMDHRGKLKVWQLNLK